MLSAADRKVEESGQVSHLGSGGPKERIASGLDSAPREVKMAG